MSLFCLEGISNMKYSEQKKKDFIQKRQQKSIIMYSVFFVIGTMGLLVGIFTNPLLDIKESMQYLIWLLILDVFALTTLFSCYKWFKNPKVIDLLLFLINLAVYINAILMSPRSKILGVNIWMPILYMFIFASFSRLQASLFFVIHLLTTLFMFYLNPSFEFSVTSGMYINIIVMSVLLYAGMIMLINVYRKHQINMYHEYEYLDSKNKELAALNEEYYATQEEVIYQYNEIEKLAFHDTLTGLLNRQGFIKNITRHLSTDCKSVLVLIDIAKFNDINTVYGFDVGDYLLNEVAANIKTLPLVLSTMGKINGDVFAIIVEVEDDDFDLENALNSLTRIYTYETTEIILSYHFGLTVLDHDSLDHEAMIKRGEMALSKAKQIPDNNYFVYEDFLIEIIEKRVMLMKELELAMSQNELYMNFQPIYYVKNNNIYGFESLVRWTHSTQGNIPPLSFITLAEKSMLIHSLGHHIVDLVKSFALEITQNELYKQIQIITINVSGKELARNDFSEKFIGQFEGTGIPPSMIGIEITETGLIDNLNIAQMHLQHFKEKGYTILLDDFGSGYSSLNYLDKLPIDILKIDKLFIDELLVNSRKRVLLKGIIQLAKSLDILTIAEGVESIDEYNLLHDMDIDLIQGYYFSKPVASTEAINLMNKSS